MSTVKRNGVSLGEKYKAITELESDIKPSLKSMTFREIQYQHGLKKRRNQKCFQIR